MIAEEKARVCVPENVKLALEQKRFSPHKLFKRGHAQTIVSHIWPRRFDSRLLQKDEARLFEIAKGVQLLAHCRWQEQRKTHPTMLLSHGLEGSSASHYMIGTAGKAFANGFNVVRLNLRNCGNTEHLTPTLYNSGLSGDVNAVVRELIEGDHLPRIFLTGFSLSGNIMLKFAGEQAGAMPREIRGVCAISPSLDLAACADAIAQRSNRIYQERFMRSLRRRLRTKQKLFPENYDASELRGVRTIRDFDERFTARDGGYRNADDYYARASALPLVPFINTPTLIIHAQDDPFIPFRSFRDPSIANNPCVMLLAPPHGGHVGFLSNAFAQNGEDRYWAENRAVEFCRLIADASTSD
ncbi:MAG: YheT family hydrolase [Pyrinomonadaceae bacterium]